VFCRGPRRVAALAAFLICLCSTTLDPWGNVDIARINFSGVDRQELGSESAGLHHVDCEGNTGLVLDKTPLENNTFSASEC
jgi:hypothetical protein